MRLINVTWFVTTMEEDDENLFLTLEIHRMLVKISLLKKKVIWETVECYFAKIYGLVIRIFLWCTRRHHVPARKLQKLVKGDKSHSKRLPTPLSCWTKTFLSSSNFSPRKSIFRVRLAGNKTKQELKTGNSSLLCSHNRDKFEYINGRSVSQSWVSSVFQTKMKRKLQESQLIQIVLKTERCCLVLTKNQICLWSILANIIYTDTRQLTGNPANIIYLRISKRQYFGFLIWVCDQVMGS